MPSNMPPTTPSFAWNSSMMEALKSAGDVDIVLLGVDSAGRKGLEHSTARRPRGLSWQAGRVVQSSSLPGVDLVEPSRFRPRFHYELLVCGLAGHELIGIDARQLSPDDALVARE